MLNGKQQSLHTRIDTMLEVKFGNDGSHEMKVVAVSSNLWHRGN